MTKPGTLTVFLLLAALALIGPGPCENPTLSDSIDPFDQYQQLMVSANQTGVAVDEPILYYLGQHLDPNSISTDTVKLVRANDGYEVKSEDGSVDYFDLVACLLEADCPQGVVYSPQFRYEPCDLYPETEYELVLSGLFLDDGTPLPELRIRFRTGPLPAGYAPSYCPHQGVGPVTPEVPHQPPPDSPPTWWEIDDLALDTTNGLSGGLGAQNPWLFNVQGVQSLPPYYGFDTPDLSDLRLGTWSPGGSFYTTANLLANPPYTPVLAIRNTDSSETAIPAASWIQVQDDAGQTMKTALPAETVPAGFTLFLYVADNGSSYYMYDNGSGGHSLDMNDFANFCCTTLCDPDWGLDPCPVKDPEFVFDNWAPAAKW